MQATLLCSDVLRTPEPEASLVQLGPKRNLCRVAFHVADTKKLSPTRDLLLRSARRQLHYAGLLDDSRSAAAIRAQPSRRAIAPGRLLRDLILLECLTDEQIGALAGRLETQWLEANESLFVKGDKDASLYIVASGILELTRRVDGTCETLGCIGSGEYIGELGLLTAAAHVATATARTDCLIYRLAQDQLSPLLADNAELSASFDKSVHKHLEVLHRDVATGQARENATSGQLLAQIRSILHLRL